MTTTSQTEINRKIYKDLLKRDSYEKNVQLCKLIEANDKMVSLVYELRSDLEEAQSRVERSEKLLQAKINRITELEQLVMEKDKIIKKMTKR